MVGTRLTSRVRRIRAARRRLPRAPRRVGVPPQRSRRGVVARLAPLATADVYRSDGDRASRGRRVPPRRRCGRGRDRDGNGAPLRRIRSSGALTDGEAEVLRLVAAGHGNKWVAHRLGISDNTARHHLESVYAKLDVRTRTGAIMLGLERGAALADQGPM